MKPFQIILLGLMPAVPGIAAGAAVDFARDVRPILEKRCYECHGEKKVKADLRLDIRDYALKGGENGPVIVAGDSAKSDLYQRITSKDEEKVMPSKGETLTQAQISTIKAWIDAGAVWPESEADKVAHADKRLQHWSFQPLKLSPNAKCIDDFISAKLTEKGLKPAPPADPRTLIRRAYFDVIGLPPSPEEVEAFIRECGQSPGSQAPYGKLVDQLLASPRFGERWARHWLDVVRFAESDGFEMNRARNSAWPYRDYVIQAFNEDKPYDQFIREQIAGDALGEDAATGFLVGGAMDAVKSQDPVLTANQRADELHDMVSTTAATFLGLTLNCARCHDHKFDPIPTVDYYSIVSMLQGVRHGERPLRVKESDVNDSQLTAMKRELEPVEAQLAEFQKQTGYHPPLPQVTHLANEERFDEVEAKFVRFTITATNGSEPCIDELEVFTAGPMSKNVALASAGAKVTVSGTYANGGNPKHQVQHLIDGRYGNDFSWISNKAGGGWAQIELAKPDRIHRIVWSRDRSTGKGRKFEDRLATGYHIEVSSDGSQWKTVASSSDRSGPDYRPRIALNDLPADQKASVGGLIERQAKLRERIQKLSAPPMVYAGRFEQPAPTHRNQRGDPMQPKEVVPPGVLSQIGKPLIKLPADAPEQERRLALANWIADAANPLTARVIVNRLWHYHFGTGLADTPSDFGLNGSRPTHPELLDWLANELISHQWSLKHIHRLILLSKTYQQKSDMNEAAFKVDSGTRLLWRFPPRRLDAEPIRDMILAVSGKLDLKMGGPGFDLFEPNENYVKVYNTKADYGPAEFRRMVYQSKPRTMLDDFFGTFDCPDAGQPAPKRTNSTTPLQALNLLNSHFALQQAGFFAERIQNEAGSDPAKQVQRAFQLIFQRPATPEEQADAVAFVQQQGLPALCRALYNSNEFIRQN